MKSRKLFPILLLTTTLTSMASAAPLFQAGNIEEGKQWPLDASSQLASYYAEGNSGKVEFNCELKGKPEGDNCLAALLKPGKNFENEFNVPTTFLHAGNNGPFIWTLTDKKTDVGNIKIFYLAGSNVTIQCQGKKI